MMSTDQMIEAVGIMGAIVAALGAIAAIAANHIRKNGGPE